MDTDCHFPIEATGTQQKIQHTFYRQYKMEGYFQALARMRKFIEISLLVVMFIALTLSLLGSNGLLRLNHLRNERDALEKKEAELTADLAQTREEISAINSDAQAIERKVRTELGFARPDEVVYVFPKSKP